MYAYLSLNEAIPQAGIKLKKDVNFKIKRKIKCKKM